MAKSSNITITGSDGAVRNYAEQESFRQEWYKQMMQMAIYSGQQIDKYELLDNAYRASGGFETGDYLIPHPSEKADKYQRRKNMAYFVNYVKPIVDALVNPIFKTDPVRSGYSNIFELFLQNVDGNDTTLTRFMKKAAIRAKLHGVEFIVVDMEQIPENTLITEKMLLEQRLYPYLYLVSPDQITNWATNKFGKLVSISYTVVNTAVDNDGNVDDVSEVWTWTENKCIKSVNGIKKEFVNPIGIIPIIPLYGAINDSDELICQSDIFALAKTSLALYNACSELRERDRAQAFSLLTYPIADDDDYESVEEPLKVGTADLLLYRSSSTAKPEFITPPPDSSDILLNEIEFMVKEIYRMASLRMSTDKNTYNVSAIARKIENQQYYQSIAELAQGLEEAEKRIYKIFCKYVGGDFESYSGSYNKEYAVLDVTEVLNSATISLGLGMTNEYNKEMRKQVARAVLADVGTVTLNNIIDSIDADNSATLALEDSVSIVQPVRS